MNRDDRRHRGRTDIAELRERLERLEQEAGLLRRQLDAIADELDGETAAVISPPAEDTVTVPGDWTTDVSEEPHFEPAGRDLEDPGPAFAPPPSREITPETAPGLELPGRSREEPETPLPPEAAAIEPREIPVSDATPDTFAAATEMFYADDGFTTPPPDDERVSDQTAEPDLELRIGAVWLNRIGLVMVIIAVALISRFVHSLLAPWHRVVGAYLLSGGFFGLGWWFRERLRQFSRPIMTGAIALAFFTSFASHFVPPMACLPLSAALTLMFLASVGLLLCAERWRSEPTAGLGIFLGHVAAFVAGGSQAVISSVAVMFLSTTAVTLFVRQNWIPLNVFSVFAAFFSHFLWTIRFPFDGHQEAMFWHHLVFLTSYYAIFLTSDLIYSVRASRSGTSNFSKVQRMAGRMVGPAALMLYATMTIWVFRITGNHWSELHRFLLPMAALQVAVSIFHRKYENPDHPLYAAAAVLFFSLGLVSLFDGLSLNLALAAEALILLIASRVLDLWFLNTLAQAVLTVNFVHFWASDARVIGTWPRFIGTLATSSVYFVKCRLMETWRPPKESGGGPLTRVLTDWTNRSARYSAYVYATAGAIMLAYQCSAFLDSPWSALAIAVSAVPIATVGIMTTSWPLMIGSLLVWMAQLSQLRAFELFSPMDTAGPREWLVVQGGLVLMASAAWGARMVGRRAGRMLASGFGASGLALAILGYCAFADIGRVVWWAPLWVILPTILWFETGCIRPVPRSSSNLLPGIPGASEQVFLNLSPIVSSILPFIAATVLWSGALSTFTRPDYALWFLLAAIAGILVWSVQGGGSRLFPGLTAELVLTTGGLFAVGTVLQPENPVFLAVPFVALSAAAAVFFLRSFPRGDRQAFTHGLAVLGIAMGATAALIFRSLPDFRPFSLWILHIAGFWVILDTLKSRERRTIPGTARFARSLGAFPVSVLSVVTAIMMGWLFQRYFGEGPRTIWMFFGVAASLTAFALTRRGMVPIVGAAGAVATHLALLVDGGTPVLHDSWVAWGVTLEALTIAFLLVAAGLRRRSGIHAAVGTITSALAVVALGFPAIGYAGTKTPFIAWIAVIPPLWILFELIRRLPASRNAFDQWTNSRWLAILIFDGRTIAVFLSCTAAVVFGLLARKTLTSDWAPLTLVLAMAILFGAVTALRKSPVTATAGGTFLLFAHCLCLFDLGITTIAAKLPFHGFALIVLTVLAGIILEKALDLATPGVSSGMVWFIDGLAVWVGFRFFSVFGAQFDPIWCQQEKMLMALVCLVLARRMRLARLWVTAMVGCWLVIFLQTVGLMIIPPTPGDRILTAGLVFILLIVAAERVSRSDDFYPLPGLENILSPGLVFVAGFNAVMLFKSTPEISEHWITVGWTVTAFAFAALGFLWSERTYRRTGLVIFGLALLRATLIDVAQAEPVYRILAFMCLGLCLVAVSYLYSRWGKKIGRWL